MNKQYIPLIAFTILAIIQLVIPASMIFRSEKALTTGQSYLIRVRPVDPYDVFRGRYVTLANEGFNYRDIPEDSRSLLKEGSHFYALLGVDEEGFAYIRDISLDIPEEDYLKMEYNLDGVVVNPFDRFYLQQDVAPKVEKAFNEAGWNKTEATYISVRIKDGVGVIEELFILGMPVEEIIRELSDEAKSDDEKLKPPSE